MYFRGERKLLEISFPFPTPLSFKNFQTDFYFLLTQCARPRFCLSRAHFLYTIYYFPFVKFFEKGVRGKKLSFKKVFPPHIFLLFYLSCILIAKVVNLIGKFSHFLISHSIFRKTDYSKQAFTG